MAGSTFQPPINLDPHQDPSQQTAFINQNFQSLAAELERNSLRIVEQGTVTVASTVLASAGVTNTYVSPIQQTQANFTNVYASPPMVLAFISSGQYAGSILPSTETSIGGTGGGISIYTLNLTTTTSFLNVVAYYVAYGAYNFTGVSIAAQTIKYYVLQQTIT